jgi:hypothetical protein
VSNRFLVILIALFSFAEGKHPAEAFPFPAITLDMQPTDTDSFILVRKGKGHGDGEERFERHHRDEFHGVSRHRGHSHRMRGFNGNRGFGGGNQNQPNGQN